MISAVGHEIDFTIADFVADVRAPTPSAAAEMVAPEIGAVIAHLQRLQTGLERAARQALEVRRLHLRQHAVSVFLREPQRVLQERQQRLDQLEHRLSALPAAALERMRERVRQLHALLQASRPDRQLEQGRRDWRFLGERLLTSFDAQFASKRDHLLGVLRNLRLLGPQQTLARGYSITRDAAGNVIRHATQVRAGEVLHTRVSDGEIISTVDDTRAA